MLANVLVSRKNSYDCSSFLLGKEHWIILLVIELVEDHALFKALDRTFFFRLGVNARLLERFWVTDLWRIYFFDFYLTKFEPVGWCNLRECLLSDSVSRCKWRVVQCTASSMLRPRPAHIDTPVFLTPMSWHGRHWAVLDARVVFKSAAVQIVCEIGQATYAELV